MEETFNTRCYIGELISDGTSIANTYSDVGLISAKSKQEQNTINFEMLLLSKIM